METFLSEKRQFAGCFFIVRSAVPYALVMAILCSAVHFACPSVVIRTVEFVGEPEEGGRREMGVAGDDVFVADDGRGHGTLPCIADLRDGAGERFDEARVMELVASELVPIEGELPVAEGEAAVGLTSGDGVGEHAAHGEGAFVRDDLPAQVHHTSTFGDDAPSGLSEVANGAARMLGTHERLKMFLGVAAGEVEKRVGWE